MRGTRGLLLLAIALILAGGGTTYFQQKKTQIRQAPPPPKALPAGVDAAALDWQWSRNSGSRPVVEVRARNFRQLQNPERRRHLRDRIVAEALSVRAAEALARSLAGAGPQRAASPAPAAKSAAADPNLRHLIGQLETHLMTRVRIEGGAERGRIEIDYYGPEDLDRLTRTILEGRRA